MKNLITFVALMLSVHFLNAQEVMSLSSKQQSMVAISANAAKGDIEGLKKAINEGFEQGLSIVEIKEVLCHLYAYAGFPRSLNALSTLQQVMAHREKQGLKMEPGKEADPLPQGYHAIRQGAQIQTELFGPVNYTFAPEMDYLLKAHLFGDVFATNSITHKDREVVTLSIISTLPGCEPQLDAHMGAAAKTGVTPAEMHDIAAVLTQKVGLAEGNRAAMSVAKFLGEAVKTAEPVDFNVWPRGEVNPFNQYFTGISYLTMMGESGAYNVTFEPGCRNYWHIHHNAVQVLVCVAGRGWYQEWGKPAVEMTPGTVITIPEGVKHWHGAAKDSWFQHLGYETKVQEGASNEWLEPVSDGVYNQLP